jgi:hypothetical protein
MISMTGRLVSRSCTVDPGAVDQFIYRHAARFMHHTSECRVVRIEPAAQVVHGDFRIVVAIDVMDHAHGRDQKQNHLISIGNMGDHPQ